MLDAVHNWGTEPSERQLAYPCDELISHPEAILFRGVTINASPANSFRWLCQMRVAPYSYDWIDNGGKQSPQVLTPGLDQLDVGQDFMTIFTLVAFEHDRSLTLRTKTPSRAGKVFGDVAVSYCIVKRSSSSCRLLAKLLVQYPPTVRGRLMAALLPWGDLIMMRRQLLNFKHLAEKSEK